MRANARRKPTRSRRGLWWVVGCTVALGLVAVAAALATSPEYALRGARIEGPGVLADAVLAEVPIGANMHSPRVRGLPSRILRDLRIESVRVRRAPDGWLDIELRPRVAMAAVCLDGGQYGLLDRDGLVFETRSVPVGVPVLVGVTASGLQVGERLDATAMATAKLIAGAASHEGLPLLVRIGYLQDGRVEATLEGGAVVRLGRPELVGRKMAAVSGVLRSYSPTDIAYVDVELLRHVVVLPRG